MAILLAGRSGSGTAAPVESGRMDRDNEGGEDTGHESNPVLEGVLAAITDEVHKMASGMRSGVMAIYRGRGAAARSCLKGAELRAALRAIDEERKAALAVIKLQVSMELVARRRAAIQHFSTSGLMGSRKRARIMQPRGP